MPRCASCLCSTPPTACAARRVLLSSRVAHSLATIRSVARRRGTPMTSPAPGLLEAEGPDLEVLVTEAAGALSSVEAAEVRCLLTGATGTGPDLLAQALGAPSLAAAAARLRHADLVPLFADETARFHAEYQRIVRLDDGGTVGHEALLRATTVDGDRVMPDQLFPAADEAGWTHVLDRVGRTTAIRDAGPWLADDLLFINFVPTSIYRPEVCLQTTERAATEAGLRMDQLVFEVTEGHVIEDVDHLDRVFAHYRGRGCRVALDDLGSGWSSLALLVRLQPDIVKLERAIVQALPAPAAVAVVTAVVDITHSYGGLVLAEGVETETQAQVARELGADLGQGWLWGRPERRTTAPSADAGRALPGAVPDPSWPDAAVALDPREGAVGAVVPPAEPELLARAVDLTGSSVVVVDALAPDMPIVYVNGSFTSTTGYPAAEAVGRNCRFLQGPGTDRAALSDLAEALRRGQPHHTTLLNVRRDGTTWWNELHLSPLRNAEGVVTHYVGFQHDVTERVTAELALRERVGTDVLTGALNRDALLTELDRQVRAPGPGPVVLFVDLDGFKRVNDRFGHTVGDTALRVVADRLHTVVRAGDLLARLGGDEFVLVLTDLETGPDDGPASALAGALAAAHRVAADVERVLAAPVELPGGPVLVGASVGVAVHPADGETPAELLRAADVAMYRAKARRARTAAAAAAAAAD
ncbi:EAL domain-containing protein [Klenkia sp. LSe6-5]|uniref:EAL domain-containing protein n=1 Tax=Klenkia sesuvii TaxID=3103137 RepID=A0ABU8DQR5_9ACTN